MNCTARKHLLLTNTPHHTRSIDSDMDIQYACISGTTHQEYLCETTGHVTTLGRVGSTHLSTRRHTCMHTHTRTHAHTDTRTHAHTHTHRMHHLSVMAYVHPQSSPSRDHRHIPLSQHTLSVKQRSLQHGFT